MVERARTHNTYATSNTTERERAKSPHIQLLRDSAAGDRKQEKNTIKKNPFEKAAEKNKS